MTNINPLLEGTPLASSNPEGAAGLVPGGTPQTIQASSAQKTSTATSTGQDALSIVEKQYPEWIWLLYTPLAPLILKLAGEGADSATIQNSLDGDPTWNKLSQSIQGNLVELATNPGEFYRNLQTQEQTIQATFNQMGLQPTQDQINAFSFQALFNNWSPQELSNHLRQAININPDGSFSLAVYHVDPTTGKAVDVFSGREAYYGPQNQPGTPDKNAATSAWGQNVGEWKMPDGTLVYYNSAPGAVPTGTGTQAGGSPQGGTLENYLQQVTQLSKQFMIRMSPQDISRQAANLMSGQETIQGVQAYLQNLAISKWGNMPDVVAAIQRGQTPQDYFAPVASEIGSTLQIDPNTIDFNSQKWANLLTTTDPKTGTTQSVPMWKIIQDVRSNPGYGFQNTPDAKASAYSFTKGIDENFGLANFGGGGGFDSVSPSGTLTGTV